MCLLSKSVEANSQSSHYLQKVLGHSYICYWFFFDLRLLSFTKILSVTADILAPTQIYKLGSNTTTFGLYYLPVVVYFGSPFAILAIVMFTFIVAIPTLILFLYPFRLFQKCLSFIPFNWHFLYAFVNSFQDCYKDGTEPRTLILTVDGFQLLCFLFKYHFFSCICNQTLCNCDVLSVRHSSYTHLPDRQYKTF